MTHDELIDKVYWHWRYVQGNDGLQAMIDYRRTILAIVELHKPKDGKKFCKTCGKFFPCSTIQAIEKELK